MASRHYSYDTETDPLSELPYYPDDWEDRRRDVFDRDGLCCRNCGRQWYEKGGTAELHAHHIVPVGRIGSHEMVNLVTLCAYCHAAAHELAPAPAIQIPRELERFIDDEAQAVRPHPEDDLINALVIPLRAAIEDPPEGVSSQRRLNLVPNAPATEVLQDLTDEE